MGLVDQVYEYFVALIVGAIMLYVLWEVVKSLVQSMPELQNYMIAIVIAAAAALVLLARKGIR